MLRIYTISSINNNIINFEFFKDIGSSVVFRYAGMVVGLVTGIIVMRTLGPDGKGEIAYF